MGEAKRNADNYRFNLKPNEGYQMITFIGTMISTLLDEIDNMPEQEAQALKNITRTYNKMCSQLPESVTKELEQ